MLKTLFLFSILVMGCLNLSGQPAYQPVRFFFRMSSGANFPLHSISNGSITDHLFTKESRAYIQFMGVGFFIKNLGLEGSVDVIPPKNSNSQEPFLRALTDTYPSYFPHVLTQNSYYEANTDPIIRVSIGPAYKFERGRLMLTGRAAIGARAVPTTTSYVRLKEKNTNEIIHLNWESKGDENNHFAIHPSISASYRLSKRFAVSFDVGSWFYRANINFIERSGSANSNETAQKEYKYQTRMIDLNVGLGLQLIVR